uniref:Slc25a-12 n=1 Tax=Schmidtea mediterranea TaxID=79327 RepID=A0A0H3YF49_SCHMD|nr:slc25a-12 [Schmidtea mediterranea]
MSTEFATDLWPGIRVSTDKRLEAARQEFRKNLIEFFSGAVGGSAGLAFGHPLDTVKTVTQNSTKRMAISEGIAGVGQHGYKTFYRGLSLPFWSYAGVNACLFTSYKFFQRLLDPEGKSNFANILSGALSGVVQLIPGTPVEVIKIHMQNDAIKKGNLIKNGPIWYIRRIVRNDGIGGLYKGVGIHAFRDVPAFIIYFYSYECINTYMSKMELMNPTLRAFVSGGIAGALSWVLLIPQDVMKTRIQAGVDKDIMDSFRALRNIGFESFFRGGTMLTLRALLVNAVTFTMYEECHKRLQS